MIKFEKYKLLGLHSGIWTFFSCINDLTVLIFFFFAGIMELALSESIDCLLLIFPLTGNTDWPIDFEDSFSSSEHEDESLDVSEVLNEKCCQLNKNN